MVGSRHKCWFSWTVIFRISGTSRERGWNGCRAGGIVVLLAGASVGENVGTSVSTNCVWFEFDDDDDDDDALDVVNK